MKKPIYFNNKFSNDQIQLIKSILKVNPNDRPSIKQILQSPWLTEKNNKSQLAPIY